MELAESSPLVDVRQVEIDHVNVTGSDKSVAAQTWIALTPLLTVLITAVGIVFTLCFQIYQTRTLSLQKVDSDWRSALEKVSVDEQASAVGALEMQSFLSDPKYGNQARTIAAAILPSVASHQEFDAAFFTLVQSTNQTNQQVIIAIASNLSNKIRTLHETALKQLKDNPNPADKSLENFVLNPDKFFSDDEQSDYLAQTYESTWKLDSAIGGLNSIWHGNKNTRPVNLDEDIDLSGVIFYNAKPRDFREVDFTHASMNDVYFLGRCTFDPQKLPKGVHQECQQN
jgi:hypothetical protein